MKPGAAARRRASQVARRALVRVIGRQQQQIAQMGLEAKELLEAQVQQRTAELRELAGYLVSAREDERGHLARELHDEFGGLFTAMKLEFARLRRIPGLPPALVERVQSIELRLNDGIAAKRRLVENLRPSALDQLGLVSSVSLLCRDTADALGIPVRTDVRAVSVGAQVELTIYRLVQESLTNIGRYAGARQVAVTMAPGGLGARIEVVDDGCGFDPARVGHGHHGLLGMRYRVESHGGTMGIESGAGRGTRIWAELPAAG